MVAAIGVRSRAGSDEAFSFSHASGSRRGTKVLRPTIVDQLEFLKNEEEEKEDSASQDDSDFGDLDELCAAGFVDDEEEE